MSLQNLPQNLIDEKGMPGVGVAYKWLNGPKGGEVGYFQETVGEWLSRPENQGGTWLIDGGWGGPPGPLRVDWANGAWVSRGFPPWSEE